MVAATIKRLGLTLCLGGTFAVCAIFASSGRLAAAEDGEVAKRIQASCTECHDADVHKAGLRLDQLKPVDQDPATLALWTRIHDRVAAGEMPPKKKLSGPEATAFTVALARQLTVTDQEHQRTAGRVGLRRLNRVEYENTVRDLLALPMLEIKDILPPDPSSAGFDDVAAVQDVSYVHVARYLEAADSALDAAMVLRPKPVSKVDRQIFTENGRFFEEDDHHKPKPGGRSESRVVHEWMALLRQPNSAQSPWDLHNRFDEPGLYRFRIRCQGITIDSPGTGNPNDDKFLPPAVDHVASIQVKDGRFLHFFDVPATPGEVEFTAYLHGNEHLVFYAATLDDRNQPGGSSPPTKVPYKGPGIAVEWMDMEGPLAEQWPPESHRRLFGDLALVKWTKESGLREPEPTTIGTGLQRRAWRAAGGPWMVESKHPAEDSERLLRAFMERAYRRPVDAGEVRRMQGLALEGVAQKRCFQDAMRIAYKAVLSSPDFLFLREAPGRLDGYALAARLSYFLWRSQPDDELTAQARSGALARSEVLHSEVERMLGDSRAARFVEDFTSQWLDQCNIFATVPDKPLYPEYYNDNYLVDSQLGETRAYFAEMLRADLGARQVITSDFAMLNERLAQLYGVSGVQGCAIRRVALPKDSPRGGFITQGSILKVTANGLTTSPVKRGAWVLDRLLGTPASPPPPDAGAIEPDTRGATTIREQLGKHRANASCAACHARIDPPGFALESFDVMGASRSKYRSLGAGEEVKATVGVREVKYRLGPKIDCSGELNGAAFADIAGLRALLLADEVQIARNLARRLLTYATGAGISFADRAAIETLLGATQSKQYGLRSLIHAVVESDQFRAK
jgi:hypothetical protein